MLNKAHFHILLEGRKPVPPVLVLLQNSIKKITYNTVINDTLCACVPACVFAHVYMIPDLKKSRTVTLHSSLTTALYPPKSVLLPVEVVLHPPPALRHVFASPLLYTSGVCRSTQPSVQGSDRLPCSPVKIYRSICFQ